MTSNPRRVFISALEFMVPQLGELPNEKLQNYLVGDDSAKKVSTLQTGDSLTQMSLDKMREFHSRDGITFQDIILNLDPASPFYPNARDIKSMRDDVVAATICLGKMLDRIKEWLPDTSSVPIFTCTSSTQAGQTAEIAEVHGALSSCNLLDEKERNCRLLASIHPLYALRVLTNSAQAFAAQNYGFREQNTTFGSTSHDGFCAFAEAVSSIQNGLSEFAVVSVSNGGGLLSLLMSQGQDGKGKVFRESPAAGCLILESEEHLRARRGRALAEVLECEDAQKIPQFQDDLQAPYIDFGSSGLTALFSGGGSFESYLAEKLAVAGKWQKAISLYPNFGTFGTASGLIYLAAAVEHLLFEQSVDCLNCDPFGRASRIRLGQAL